MDGVQHAAGGDGAPGPGMTAGPRDLPVTMRAIAITAPGGPDVLALTDQPVPAPGPGEVLVAVAAAGVNRPDVLQRRGLYPPPPGASALPGLEIAGEVVATGPAGPDGVNPARLLGRAVAALVPGGGYAPYCTAKAAHCLPVPDGLPLTQAAAMPETLLTVWANLFQRGGAADGDAVLVHGGTSGIGTMAIALGRLFGLRVIVTCGTTDKCAAALALGAQVAIDYAAEDFAAAVLAATGGRGVDVVLDMVGGDYVARNLQCLAEDGRHVSIAFQRGMVAEVAIPLVMQRRLTLTGSTLRGRSDAFKAMLVAEVAELAWPLVADGGLRPVIDTVLPLAEAASAHARMEAGAHVGKIVLDCRA